MWFQKKFCLSVICEQVQVVEHGFRNNLKGIDYVAEEDWTIFLRIGYSELNSAPVSSALFFHTLKKGDGAESRGHHLIEPDSYDKVTAELGNCTYKVSQSGMA